MSTDSTGTQILPKELLVTYLSISSLSAYAGNARTHSKTQIRKIADSIRAFGFTNPILIDRTNTIVAGHGHVEAAKSLKLEQVPTICLENLTPAQVRAYVIADNRLAEDAGWDPEILKIELQHLIIENEIDISLTGFEIPEIDLVLSASEAEADPADELPEESAQVISQPGDLWRLGDHRIFCGDARDEFSFSTRMQDRRASVVLPTPV